MQTNNSFSINSRDVQKPQINFAGLSEMPVIFPSPAAAQKPEVAADRRKGLFSIYTATENIRRGCKPSGACKRPVVPLRFQTSPLVVT